ncbi:hypothetical protein [Streptomyces sp. NPDC005262]|uniref:hypothetical protein n=1 Tax=Streptomyces sp. NPDC005262 TaxID=3364710 RepID=UPI0036C6A86C
MKPSADEVMARARGEPRPAALGMQHEVRGGPARWSLMIMQRKDAPGSGDVEQLLDELYATPPPAFVSRREELAAEAKDRADVPDSPLS